MEIGLPVSGFSISARNPYLAARFSPLPGAGDILPIIAEARVQSRVRVEAEKEVFESQVGDIQIQSMATLIRADFDASHRQVDAGHQVLLFDLLRHLLEPAASPAANRPRA